MKAAMSRGKLLGWCCGLVMAAVALVLAACGEGISSNGNWAYQERMFHSPAAGAAMTPLLPSDEIMIVPIDGAPRPTGNAAAGGPGSGGARGGGRGGLVAAANSAEDSYPIPGSPILATRDAAGKMVAVPLKHTDVAATISGYIASVGVTQQYTNPYSEKIEAVYVFPLPENAGVSDFVMTIGDRHIRGIVRERAEAQRIYDTARAQGYVVSMMSQERPNIFTQKVANIEPGKAIDISIRYFHTLAYNDGWFEWVFPMVLGPRYNPAGSTEGVGAAPRGMAGATEQKTEVQYLRPGERSGRDIALSVQLDAGMPVEEIVSVNHKIRRVDGKNDTMVVQLDPVDSLPNKDFILRYKVAGKKAKTGLFVQKDKTGNGGWFTLMIVPPEDLKRIADGMSPQGAAGSMALGDLQLSFGSGMKVSEIYPRAIPDVMAGRPVVIAGRFTEAEATAKIDVRGRAGNQPVEFLLPVEGTAEENPAIALIWARMKIADLYQQARVEKRDVLAELKETALKYGIVSAVTNFVVVDSTQRTAGDRGTTVAVPVPVPEGVRYDTTVGGGGVAKPE